MGKIFALGLLGVGIAIAVSRVFSPSFNAQVNEEVYTKIALGMNMRQVESIVGRPTRTSTGEPRKLATIDGVKYILLECSSGRDVLAFFDGPTKEQIVVAFAHDVVSATEYVVDGISAYYRGPKTEVPVDSISFYRPPTDRVRIVTRRIAQSLSPELSATAISAPVATGSATSASPPSQPPQPPPQVESSGPVATTSTVVHPPTDMLDPLKASAAQLRNWLLQETATAESQWKLAQQSRNVSQLKQVASKVSSAAAYHEFAYGECRKASCNWDAYTEKRRQCRLPEVTGDPWFEYATMRQGIEGALANLTGAERAALQRDFSALQRDLEILVKDCIARHAAVSDGVFQAIAKLEDRPVERKEDSVPKPPVKKTRTWISNSGHTIEAEFVSYASGVVKLRKEDGQELSVDMDRLSEQDQSWIRRRRYQQPSP